MYEVLLHPDAQKVYINADQALANKISRCLQQLEQTPRSHPNIKVLKGDYAGYYRYRIGDYSNPKSVVEDPHPQPLSQRGRGEKKMLQII